MRISIKTPILVVILMTIAGFLSGAYLRFEPQEVYQPDGTKLSLFASGDEFYNWMHDKEGYTINQNEKGWYVYLDKDSHDELFPTDLIVGRDNPAIRSLSPWINISAQKIGEIRKRANQQLREIDNGRAPTSGDFNNLVVFIRFSDQGEFGQSISTYNSMFNGTSGNTMQAYYSEVSYGQLNISSTFYPTPSSMVVSWQDTEHTRNYFVPYSTSNTIGYQNDTERRNREHTLLVAAVNGISSQVPTGLNIDGDGDGRADNVVFIIQGATTSWSTLLWPHRWSLYTQTVSINGKRVYDYNFQLSNSLASSGNGVLCHEMFHSLGAPDLYHYTSNGITPVGGWDLMETDSDPPEHMTAFMKHKYGHWISDIPILNNPGTYTLNYLASTTNTNTCYRINYSTSPNEYAVVEFRKKTGTFENSVPGTGMIIYRIKTDCGNGNADGPPDELYVYRLNGTPSVNGTIASATFSSETGRTAFKNNTNPYCFLYDGTLGNISIVSIGSSSGSTITFTLDYVPPQKLKAVASHAAVALSWETPGTFTPSGYKVFRNGILLTTTTNLSYLDTNVTNGTTYSYYLKAVFSSPTGESEASNTVVATPKSLPVQNLAGIAGNATCTLSWQMPVAGIPTGYKVYRNSILKTTTLNLSYTDNTVSNNTMYSYYVTATYANPTAESEESSVVYLTPIDDISITVGTGTVTGQSLPMEPTKHYSYSQTIYLQSDINQPNRKITKLAWQYTGGAAYTDSIRVYLGHTNLSVFANPDSWIPLSSLTQVYSGLFTTTVASGWIEITFNAPFYYNNTQNLVIAFDENKPGFQSNGFYSTSVTGNRSLVYRSDTINPDPASPPAAGAFRKAYIPNTRMYLVTAYIPAISVTPALLNFGDIAIGTTHQMTINVQNTGIANMTGDITTPAGFTISYERDSEYRNSTAYTILPNQSKEYTIYFSPTANQSYNGNLTITSNDPLNPTKLIPLNGTGFIPPNLILSTLSLTENLLSGNNSVQTLSMQNAGSRQLTYTIAIVEPDRIAQRERSDTRDISSDRDVPWLTCSSMSGSIEPEQSYTLDIGYLSGNAIPGLNQALINISSNDPAHPTQTVAVNLNVALNPPGIMIYNYSDNPRISWNAVPGALTYKIFSSATYEGTYSYVTTTSALYYDCETGFSHKYYRIVSVYE